MQNIQSAPGRDTAGARRIARRRARKRWRSRPRRRAGKPQSTRGEWSAGWRHESSSAKRHFRLGCATINAAKYSVASGEFQDVIHYYPMDELAGSAQYYLGEIAYRQGDYTSAVNDYNAVLEAFSGSPKAPAAQLHKGFALIQQGKRDAGVHELRLLIQRHPQTPEASQARAKLTAMGIHSTTAAQR